MRWVWIALTALLEALRRFWTAKGAAAGEAQAKADASLTTLQEERAQRLARHRTLAAILEVNRRKLAELNGKIKEAEIRR